MIAYGTNPACKIITYDSPSVPHHAAVALLMYS